MKKTILTAFAALLVVIPAAEAQKVNQEALLAKIEKSVRANRNFLRTTHSFTFTEEGVGLTVKVQEKQEEYNIPYANIVRIFERPDVFYIYISGTQALIVPKSSLEGGTADDLAALFRVLKKRFREKKNLRGRTLPQE